MVSYVGKNEKSTVLAPAFHFCLIVIITNKRRAVNQIFKNFG